MLLAFKLEEEHCDERKWTLDAGESKERDSPPLHQKRAQLCNTGFSPVNSVSDV